jgi:cell division protein FtsQ
MARRAQVNQPRKTTRQRESERVVRERAARQRRQRVFRICGLSLALLVSIAALGYGLWGWQSGLYQQMAEQMQRGTVRLSARAGFVVKDIYLDGRETVTLDAIRRTAQIELGQPLFATSVSELKARLESIPAIKVAHIERLLPSGIHIHIVERKPIAIWQHEQQLHLIDDNGVVMAGSDMKRWGKLLLVVGPDAPEHSVELLHVLATEPDLFNQIKAAIRVGGRRWNIRFHNGVEVKLPEKNLEKAWSRLVNMQQAQKVLERDIVAIDLRLADRVYVKQPNHLHEGPVPHRPKTASET